MSERRSVGRVAALVATALTVFFVAVLVIAFNKDVADPTTPLLMKPAPEVKSTTYDGEIGRAHV